MAEKKDVTVSLDQLAAMYRQHVQQLETIENEKRLLQSVLQDAILAEEALKEIKNSSSNQKILISLGSGLFVSAQISPEKEIKANIGADVIKDVSLERAREIIDERKVELSKKLEFVSKNEARAAQSAANLENILKQAEAQMRSQAREKSSSGSTSIVS